MIFFPLLFEKDDNGTLLVTCPLLPEVTTFGEDENDALNHGRMAVEEAVAARMAEWSDIPFRYSDKGMAHPVTLPLQVAVKLELYHACREANISRAELVRRLGWHREQVDRLFRPDHASRLDQIEAAMKAAGRTVDFRSRAVA